MKAKLILTLSFIAIFSITGYASAGGDKAFICHTSEDEPGVFTTSSVNGSSLLKHLDHGDLLGSCESHEAVLCDDENLCTVDVLLPDGTCDNSGAVVCNDQILCTTDACVADRGCVSTVDCPAATPVCDPNATSGTGCTGTTGDCPLEEIARDVGWYSIFERVSNCTSDGSEVEAAQKGRNPQTGETIKIKASKTVRLGPINSALNEVITITNNSQGILIDDFSQIQAEVDDLTSSKCINFFSSPLAAVNCLLGECTDPGSLPVP